MKGFFYSLLIASSMIACNEAPESTTEEHCQAAMTADQKAQFDTAEAEHNRLLKESVEAAVTDYDAAPLIFGDYLDATNPFPDAIRVDDSTRVEGNYLASHEPEAGHHHIYETEPGSKKFFIVDEVGGDGYGSNRLNRPGDGQESTEEYPMHSWWASSDNQLLRIQVEGEIQSLGTITLCGCGSWAAEVGLRFAKDSEPEPLRIAAFFLPSDQIPRIVSNIITASYRASAYTVQYRPRKGKKCEQLVC